MPGKNFHLTPLETRKQLLLVQSELNRVQLVNDIADLKNEAEELREQIAAISSLASSATRVVDGFSAIGRAFTHQKPGGPKKSSWISTLFNGVRTGASILSALRSKQNDS